MPESGRLSDVLHSSVQEVFYVHSFSHRARDEAATP